MDFVVQIKPFYLDDQKSRDKNLKSWERKELLRSNKKHFLSFLKGFDEQITRFFLKLRVRL